jgi:hypothetical protein
LTVRETFDFAFQCRTGGTHDNIGMKLDEHDEKEQGGTAVKSGGPANNRRKTIVHTLDTDGFTENLTIKGLDLSVCADTFVGNNQVRGVSGGQRRRVTVGVYIEFYWADANAFFFDFCPLSSSNFLIFVHSAIVGEMMQGAAPVACADEISTGLVRIRLLLCVCILLNNHFSSFLSVNTT